MNPNAISDVIAKTEFGPLIWIDSGNRSKNARPTTDPALKPRTRCSLS